MIVEQQYSGLKILLYIELLQIVSNFVSKITLCNNQTVDYCVTQATTAEILTICQQIQASNRSDSMLRHNKYKYIRFVLLYGTRYTVYMYPKKDINLASYMYVAVTSTYPHNSDHYY